MSIRSNSKILPFILILFCLAIVSCSAQRKTRTPKKKENKEYSKAREAYRGGKYDEALKIYTNIIKKAPTDIRALGERAIIYYELKKYPQAEVDFIKALEIDKNKNNRLFLSLATVQRLQEKYSEAATSYGKYLETCDKDQEQCIRAKKYYNNTLFAAEAIKSPVDYNPLPLHKNVNTQNSQYLPHFTIDGMKMIYTERVDRQEDLYVSFKKDTSFSKGVPINGLNTPSNEGAHCISPDGKHIIFTVCDGARTYGSCDLYQSVLTTKGWTRPTNLGKNVNSSAWDSQPSISGDGKRLYFASKREGGNGGSDIYVATKKGTAWGDVENLGDNVNTTGNDESPFIHHDNRTMYFRSDGHPGMGDYDLFLVQRNSLNEPFAEVKNMGYPINSPGSEGGLYVSLDGKQGYFASDQSFFQGERNGDPQKHLDIYVFDMPKSLQPFPVTYFKANIIDGNTSMGIDATLTVQDLNSKEIYLKSLVKADEEILVPIPIGANYLISITNKDYLYHAENFSLTSVYAAAEPLEKTIKIYPLPKADSPVAMEASKPIILNNIFFETNSAMLKLESNIEIENLVGQLKDNPKLRIKIQGHTDNVGGDNENLTLSTARAKSVKDALVKKGIDQARLQYEGLGETMPIDTNETEEGRQRNRRTEFVVTGS